MLNKKYNNVCEYTEYDKYWWSTVPHMYTSFYVYKYATGLIAAVSLAEKVLTGKADELENYFKFLSAGGSDFSTTILKNAGVDLETDEPYNLAFNEFENIIKQMEDLINN
jgi:oligoendopeptidase F